MEIKIIKSLPLLLCLCPVSSFASVQPVNESNHYPMNKFSVNAAVGYLGGESNEYVYREDGSKLSELNWTINGASVLKGEINVDVLPWLSANANGWGTVGTNSATMNDYDWMNPAQTHWTDWSNHPDTDLDYANNIDVNLRGWFLQQQHSKLGVTAGYAQSSFSFLAKGGCFQYENGLYTGCFPDNLRGISYQQTFETVYLGLTGKYLMNQVELAATVKVGPQINATDTDQHYLRDLVFTDSGSGSTFFSATLSAGYYFNQATKVFFEASGTSFSNDKANTVIEDTFTGESRRLDNQAGLGNNNYVLALGIQYALQG